MYTGTGVLKQTFCYAAASIGPARPFGKDSCCILATCSSVLLYPPPFPFYLAELSSNHSSQDLDEETSRLIPTNSLGFGAIIRAGGAMNGIECDCAFRTCSSRWDRLRYSRSWAQESRPGFFGPLVLLITETSALGCRCSARSASATPRLHLGHPTRASAPS